LQERIETFARSESATNFKGFEALHNIVLDIDNQLLCSDVQTEAIKHMYDELRRSFETYQQKVNKMTLTVKRKKIMHLWKMTLHDTFKQ
jgi:signal recognition particle GTPase